MKLNYVDKLAYSVLFAALLLGTAAIFSLKYEPNGQFATIVGFSIFYLVWAVVYHLFKRDLNLTVFLEYLIIASIALVVGFLVFGS